jgi:hypothetical protein
VDDINPSLIPTSTESESTLTTDPIQPTLDVNGQPVADEQRQPSQHVPYERFKEVNDKMRALEQQNLQMQGYNQALLQQSQLQGQPQPGNKNQFNSVEFWTKAEQDPEGWMSDLTTKAKQEALQEIRNEMYVQNTVQQAESSVLQQFPQLNTPQARRLLIGQANYLNSVLDHRQYSVADVYNLAAQDVIALTTGTTQQQQTVQQQRTDMRQQGFAEGGGNMVPNTSPDQRVAQKQQEAYQKRDLNDLASIHLQKLSNLR